MKLKRGNREEERQDPGLRELCQPLELPRGRPTPSANSRSPSVKELGELELPLLLPDRVLQPSPFQKENGTACSHCNVLKMGSWTMRGYWRQRTSNHNGVIQSEKDNGRILQDLRCCCPPPPSPTTDGGALRSGPRTQEAVQ